MNKEDLVKNIAEVLETIKDGQALVNGIFLPLDNALQTLNDPEKNRFIELLDETEEKVKQMSDEKQDWWLSEIYLRKGRCAKGIFEKKEEYLFLKQAYAYALKSNNNEVILQSGLLLGFDFFEFTTSIREILDIQMKCIEAVCQQSTAVYTRLKIIGINLFNFWHQIEYRRLSEHDLKAKQFVIDGAKSLEQAGFDEERASPIMIMLISKVFEFEEECLEWAKQEAGILDIPIPESIKRKIGSLNLDINASS